MRKGKQTECECTPASPFDVGAYFRDLHEGEHDVGVHGRAGLEDVVDAELGAEPDHVLGEDLLLELGAHLRLVDQQHKAHRRRARARAGRGEALDQRDEVRERGLAHDVAHEHAHVRVLEEVQQPVLLGARQLVRPRGPRVVPHLDDALLARLERHLGPAEVGAGRRRVEPLEVLAAAKTVEQLRFAHRGSAQQKRLHKHRRFPFPSYIWNGPRLDAFGGSVLRSAIQLFFFFSKAFGKGKRKEKRSDSRCSFSFNYTFFAISPRAQSPHSWKHHTMRVPRAVLPLAILGLCFVALALAGPITANPQEAEEVTECRTPHRH